MAARALKAQPPRRIRRASKADRARARKAAQLKRARADVGAFIEYALPHEKTRRKVENQPFHKRWQSHLDVNPYAVIIAPVEHAKTQQIAVGRLIHMLGKDPNLRIGLISNTERMASKILNQIRLHIEKNPRVREVFPHLRKSPRIADPWHSTNITVARSSISKDPSIQALGVYGQIVGSRLDVIVMDDVLDFQNTRTQEQRQKLIDWFDTEVYTRAQDEPGEQPAKIWVIGTPWHPKDLLHNLSERPDFMLLRLGAVSNPDAPERNWKPLWPKAWPLKRLLLRKRNTPPVQFARKWLCRVRLDETSRFRESWINQCLVLGRGRTLLPNGPRRPDGRQLPCFTGVDLGPGDKEKDSLTSLFTLALDERQRRLLVNIESGRWQAPEIVQRIRATHRRYNSIVMVESNGVQRWMVQFTGIDGSWVRAFNTGTNKYDEDFGIETIAVEMENSMWVIPSGASGRDLAPEIQAWINDMLFYDPELHTGDRLMASWFAREAARQFAGKKRGNVDTQTR